MLKATFNVTADVPIVCVSIYVIIHAAWVTFVHKQRNKSRLQTTCCRVRDTRVRPTTIPVAVFWTCFPRFGIEWFYGKYRIGRRKWQIGQCPFFWLFFGRKFETIGASAWMRCLTNEIRFVYTKAHFEGWWGSKGGLSLSPGHKAKAIIRNGVRPSASSGL
jgi:hypothetical protein